MIWNSRSARLMAVLFLEHDPEKWEPVFRKDHAQTKTGSLADADSMLAAGGDYTGTTLQLKGICP
jgi:hypothetical protein